ncbi:hypothetical protein ABK040_012169 [Willaertia magna]
MQLASRAKLLRNEWWVTLKTADRFLFYMWQRKTHYKYAYNNLLKKYKLSFDQLKNKGIIDEQDTNKNIYKLIEDLSNRTKRLEEENMALINNKTVLEETIEKIEEKQKKMEKLTDVLELALAEEVIEEGADDEEEEFVLEEEEEEEDNDDSLEIICTSEEEEYYDSEEDELELSQSTLELLTQSDYEDEENEGEEKSNGNSFSPITQPTTPTITNLDDDQIENDEEEVGSEQENEITNGAQPNSNNTNSS